MRYQKTNLGIDTFRCPISIPVPGIDTFWHLISIPCSGIDTFRYLIAIPILGIDTSFDTKLSIPVSIPGINTSDTWNHYSWLDEWGWTAFPLLQFTFQVLLNWFKDMSNKTLHWGTEFQGSVVSFGQAVSRVGKNLKPSSEPRNSILNLPHEPTFSFTVRKWLIGFYKPINWLPLGGRVSLFFIPYPVTVSVLFYLKIITKKLVGL